jgi:hypothetical protein
VLRGEGRQHPRAGVQVGLDEPGVEGVGEVSGADEAVLGPQLAGPLHDPAQLARHALVVEALEPQLALGDLGQQIAHQLGLEAGPAGQQLEQQHAGGVDVAGGAARDARQHLGRHEAQVCATGGRRGGVERADPRGRAREADQAHVAGPRDQHVRRANALVGERQRAAVGRLGGVRVVERARHLAGHEGRQLEGQRLTARAQRGRELRQVAAVHQLTRQEGALGVLGEVQQRGHAGVLHEGQRLRLFEQPLATLGVVRHASPHTLDQRTPHEAGGALLVRHQEVDRAGGDELRDGLVRPHAGVRRGQRRKAARHRACARGGPDRPRDPRGQEIGRQRGRRRWGTIRHGLGRLCLLTGVVARPTRAPLPARDRLPCSGAAGPLARGRATSCTRR